MEGLEVVSKPLDYRIVEHLLSLRRLGALPKSAFRAPWPIRSLQRNGGPDSLQAARASGREVVAIEPSAMADRADDTHHPSGLTQTGRNALTPPRQPGPGRPTWLRASP